MAGCTNGEFSRLEASSNDTVCHYRPGQHSKCNDMICKTDELNMEQLIEAKKLGILEQSPEDELEGELIYYRKRLLHYTVARKQFAGHFSFPFSFAYFRYFLAFCGYVCMGNLEFYIFVLVYIDI